MEHLLLKAATTATDEGVFEAVISTASEDRDGDIVEPSGLVKALAKWAAIGKLVPLAYSHRDPATGQAVVVGHIDPATARVDGNRVITKGWVDQSTERGAETWRLVKSGTLSFSYGYLVPEGGATKRAGKKTGFHIREIDVYEISVVPVGPANNETLVLGWKSLTPAEAQSAVKELQEVKERLDKLEKALETQKKADVTDKEPVARSVDPLRQQAEKAALELASGGLSQLTQPKQAPAPEPPDLIPVDELKRQSRDLMLQVLSGMEL